MKILTAEFVASVAAGGHVPVADRPVVAMVGRSNVGKSSLINALTRGRIARVGATPGTTRLINVYRARVSASSRAKPTDISFADLPGYGFARGGRAARLVFNELTRKFFDQAIVSRSPRPSATRGFHLTGILLVIDARHPGLAQDLAAHQWIIERRYPFVVVMTKHDRLSRANRAVTKRENEQHFGRAIVATSSKTGEGLDRLWAVIVSLL